MNSTGSKVLAESFILRVAQNLRPSPGGEKCALVVWTGDEGAIAGVQLCYQKSGQGYALTWKHDKGFVHNKVDDGEGRTGRYKGIAILLPDGNIDFAAVAHTFKERSGNIDFNESERQSIRRELAALVAQAAGVIDPQPRHH